MRASIVAKLCCLMCLGSLQAAVAQLRLDSADPAPLTDGAGASLLKITNPGKSPVPLKLSAGAFHDDTSLIQLPSAKAEFNAAVSGDSLPLSVDPGQTIQVIAKITGLAGAATSDAQLFNHSSDKSSPEVLGDLHTWALDTPIKVSIDGDGAPDKSLQTVSGHPASLTLKNGSTRYLNLDWYLAVNGARTSPANLILAPNSTATIELSPPPGTFSLVDFVRPSPRTGQLILSLHAPFANPTLLPFQSLPVSFTTMRAGPELTPVLSGAYIIFLLLIGAGLSLLGNSVLPNIVTKVSLVQRMSDLASRTSSVSIKVDSYLRVLLRLERKKIEVTLHDVRFWTVTSVERLQEASASLDRLEKRLCAAERLDELRRKLQRASESAPPSIIDDLDKLLQQAADQLHSFALPADDLSTAKGYLDKADQKLGLLADIDSQAKIIAENFKQLKTRFNDFPVEYYADLETALPGVFSIRNYAFDDASRIVSPMFFAIDHGIAAMHLALDYAMVRESIPSGPSHNCAEPGVSMRSRLLQHECELLELLGTLSWKALRSATLLLQQMREDVYIADLINELRHHRARITIDTQRARPFLPVFFTLSFTNPRFDNAAAINGLAFEWRFSDGLVEPGTCKVCHYFQGNEPQPGHRRPTLLLLILWDKLIRWVQRKFRAFVLGSEVTHDVHVKVNVLNLEHPIDPPEEKLPIQAAARPRERSRAVAELLRVLIALGVALAGLAGGALQQLAKLDFAAASFAIIGIGFSADAVKNLLSKSQKT